MDLDAGKGGNRMMAYSVLYALYHAIEIKMKELNKKKLWEVPT